MKSRVGNMTLRLEYKPPYEFDQLLTFFRMRALVGVEVVDEASYARSVRIPRAQGTWATGWLRVENDAKNNALLVTLSKSLASAEDELTARLRRQFDVDCDPHAVYEGLTLLDDMLPGTVVKGTRLPGCFEPFETACRAVLGQQVSVAAANKLAARVIQAYGVPVETGVEGLTHAFPSPVDVCALNPIEDALGPLGVIKTRARTIAEIARLLEAGELDLESGEADEQIKRLLAIKGIGPWSANYIAMRVLAYADAFMETDAGIRHALPDWSPKEALALAQQWRPYRSYATICLWNSL